MSEPILPIRHVGIDTWRENVVFLHRDCPVVRAAGFQALAKVRVQSNGKMLIGVLNVVDDEGICPPCELGLSEEAFRRLGAAPGQPAHIEQAEPPPSIAALHRKIAGDRLEAADLRAIVQDIAAARYARIELAAFVVATNQFELDRDEVLHLTEAMIATGQRIDWQREIGAGPIVDKHCIGGIPGNRTSMLVVPIVAAHGMLCPNTSSRAITSPAGTADTMEVLAEVELPLERMKEIVRATHGCLAWGGTADLSPADDILISVERPLGIDSPGQMVASILSKKVAAGVTHLVLDIPMGPTAKVRSMAAAQRLKRLFEYVAARLRLELDAQGRREQPTAVGSLGFEVTAPADGTVIGVDNLRLARIARTSGAPQVRGAGVDLFVKLGDAVRAGQPLYRVHAQSDADLAFARQLVARGNGFTLGGPEQVPREFASAPSDVR